MHTTANARDLNDGYLRTRRAEGVKEGKAEHIDLAGETARRSQEKPEEVYDNSFVNNLEKSGFFKELWGKEDCRR